MTIISKYIVPSVIAGALFGAFLMNLPKKSQNESYTQVITQLTQPDSVYKRQVDGINYLVVRIGNCPFAFVNDGEIFRSSDNYFDAKRDSVEQVNGLSYLEKEGELAKINAQQRSLFLKIW